MNRKHQLPESVLLALIFTAIALWWHLVVVVTTGAAITNLKAGLNAILANLGMSDITGGARPATGLTLGVFLVGVVAVFTVWGVRVWQRSATSGTRGELASGRQMRAAVAGPKSFKQATTEVVAYLDGKAIRLRQEDNGSVVGPPRMGKSLYLVVALILDAFGAVVATSTKPDILRLTAGIRRRVGRVLVFDPEHVTGWPTKVKWNIVAGCEDDETAERRATALVSSRDLGDARNASFFQEGASVVLQCLLMAAALKPGGSMRDVQKWARDFSREEPYTILRTDPRAPIEWDQDLSRFCRAEAKETVDSTDMSLRLVLKSFATGRLLDSVCPGPGDEEFDPARHYLTRDTLYLFTESGKKPKSAPVITALVTEIEHAARRAANRTASGRIDPPMTLPLDEIANVAPIADLSSLMSDGSGRGLLVWPFVQSRTQLAVRYGRDDAKIILDNAAATFVLTGSKDMDLLKEISDIAGPKDVLMTSNSATSGPGGTEGSTSQQTSWQERPLLTPNMMRTLPVGQATMIYRHLPPAIVVLMPWWERKDAADIRASQRWVLEQEGLTGDAADRVEAEMLTEAMSTDVAEESTNVPEELSA